MLNISSLPLQILHCNMSNLILPFVCFMVLSWWRLINNSKMSDSRLVFLAFAGSIGMTFVILGCALPQYKIWWPFFVVLFYALAPIPTLIARRYTEDAGNSVNPCLELAIFVTMGFVVSSFALPIVLARSPMNDPVIQWGACYLTLAGNVIVYLTEVGFFITVVHEDSDYSMW